ncbi:SGNH/GDSL hydrolase family protein [Amycolatopsis minnesotensis]
MFSRRGLTIAAVAAVAALFTGTTSVAVAAERVRYVALGDSYTSGPFIPLMRLDPLGCARSTNNYPSLLSRKLKPASFTDVSCGGAATANMTTSQSVPLGTNPPQFAALRADTDLVTIGIGGNDFTLFGTLIDTCPKLRASDPAGNPCQRNFTVDGVDTMKVTAAKIRPRITAVLAGIHARSPRATVLAIGYPRIAPATGTCPDLPFAAGDYAWLSSIEEALNAAVSDAVADDGASSYVDIFTPSLGHDACAGGAAWINGKDLNILAAANYHPFRAGMEGVANVTYRALAAARR